jgi:hypothetical protein
MSTKKIEFNPLFLVGGSSKSKKKNIKSAPLISPNVLKNKLLKKIKEHKNKEISVHNKVIAEKKKLDKEASKIQPTNFDNSDNSDNSNNEEIVNYTDDFNESLNYLLSLKNKNNNEKTTEQPLVNLELPEELIERNNNNNNNNCITIELPQEPTTSSTHSTSYKQPPAPPWGVLKNGQQPTYRQFNNKTLKNTPSLFPRELKFEEIKNKTTTQQNIEPITKQKVKRSIRRKYMLGKSKTKRCVGVLLKDKDTRKKILQAQKDLKGESINDVKKYLRNHNLIKIGTFAPNDVVRKLYESAMFAGEITNSNEDTMLHNFIKDNNEHPIF